MDPISIPPLSPSPLLLSSSPPPVSSLLLSPLPLSSPPLVPIPESNTGRKKCIIKGCNGYQYKNKPFGKGRKGKCPYHANKVTLLKLR